MQGPSGYYDQLTGYPILHFLGITGIKKAAHLRQLIRSPCIILTLDDAKVLLFFELTKFFDKKMHFSAIFCKKAAFFVPKSAIFVLSNLCVRSA